MSNRGRRSNKRGDRRGHLAFSNEPETFDIHSSSSSPLPESDAKPKDESTHTPSQGTSTSPDEGLTIAKSTPFKLNPTHFKKHTKPLQNMQPAAASGMNTPEQRASPSYQASHLSQEVGTSSQLDLGAPRPGHGRTPSAGTPNLRRNVSSTLITNVDKHGGPRRRRSKTNLRSKSRSQSLSRPASPTESISSELSSIGGGKSLTIVLKLGTSSICDPITHMPMLANLSLMVETICKLKEMGHRVVLVSSGAVGIGLRRLDMPVKPKELAVIQAIAAVGQGRLMALYDGLFGQLGQPVAQVLLTRNDLSQRTQYLNACNTFEALLEMSVVPIVNENDTVSLGEIRFGDNDTLSAITAGMVHADYLFLLTDVDCLYTDNPRTNPMAKQVTHVTDIKALRDAVDVSSAGSAVGTGGMATKLIAAELATAAGVTTVITRGSTPQKVIDIIEHFSNPDLPADAAVPASALCTRFVAKSRPMIDRKWWILHGMYCSGTVYVDAGAVVALARFKKSLFAAGVKRVEGVFSSNQAVRVVYEPETNGEPVDVIEIGHGLVNYTSAEISRIRGCHSSEFEAILGYCDSDNVINRGNMVITIPDQVLDDVFVTRTHKTKIRAEQRVPVPASSSNLSAI
ncbi:Glutamate 5-kinase [Coemansia sp. RSA 1807]|nr:Glutamate 5-kinase [Coemansia sp. RSA 1591]KAJ2155251.1 Glutamate 5-kinase [Coemansia sp. RSA 637]KAJ2278492.1 Glutamate 5-kinase [Coemansia sp. RSA 451]KAJ2283960.1 Glutamate 5-kinase [Coemansia sp. RSA 370]KAJ2292359.1 Glutamate 5-kinase [Coemansia sp. RSA 355]KAJ2556078.1 Glutamate 5-kinase [Coemansia sp. RSA 1878]KAJ2573941.1 Glutamate 5-kinase [Coemansia sp. RSA 1807]